MDRVSVGQLSDIDALVGRYLIGKDPHTHWEDSHAQLRFESVEEALEALREPYFQQFIPADDRSSTVLREIQEFPQYTVDLNAAWEIVDKLSSKAESFRVWREHSQWMASFGEYEPAGGQTAPIAICLAALRARGIEVEFLAGEGMTNDAQEDELFEQYGIRPGTLAD